MKKKEIKSALCLAMSCLDNIDFLANKHKEGAYETGCILDAILNELRTGAYAEASQVFRKMENE
jgi:hypothetical protein